MHFKFNKNVFFMFRLSVSLCKDIFRKSEIKKRREKVKYFCLKINSH